MERTIMRIDECCVSVSDGDHLPPPKSANGVPFITISNIDSNTNSIDFSGAMYVPREYYESISSIRKAEPGDILYSVVGSFGIPVLIKDTKEFVFQRHIAILRPDRRIVIPEFLYYIMRSNSFFAQADAYAIGSAQRTLSLGSLRKMKAAIPSFRVQDRIVSILAAYDNLIEVNNKRLKVLEQMAENLYKEWFVRFRFPGHETAEFENGIPNGWRKAKLKSLAVEVDKPEKPENKTNYNHYLPIDKIPSKAMALLEEDTIDNAESSLIAFRQGDILFGAMRPYFHKVIIAPFNGLTRTTCFVINAREPAYRLYLYMLLYQGTSVDYATTVSVGSTMPYTRWKDFGRMSVIIPDIETVNRFNCAVEPIIDQIITSYFVIKNLTNQRDLLLPRLMNGKLEV